MRLYFCGMKAVKGNSQLIADGRQLEKDGQFEDAAAAYRQVADRDPGNRDAVGRLLVVYRRLKEHRKELEVIEMALGAVAQRDREMQKKWISEHPGAAKVGKEVLLKLGGQSVSAYGTDPLVGKLLKRKAILEKKVGEGKTKKRSKKKAGHSKETKWRDMPTNNKKTAAKKEIKGWPRMTDAKKEAAAASRRAEAERRKKAAIDRREAEEKRKQEAEERKVAREAKALKLQEEMNARKAVRQAEMEARRAEKEAKTHFSLFVISLRYLVSLEKIDAVMQKHVAFLNKHFAAGDFLVSGRQEPRTGGIIIARAKNREAVERMMAQDPFVKGRLASVDIVEFVANKMGKDLEGWAKRKR